MAIPIVVENWCIAISCLGMVMIHGSVSTLFIQQLRSSPILCVDDTFKSFEKKKTSTHMAFMCYFYSFIFHESFFWCFFLKLDLYLAWHTVDSPGFPTLLARQWRQSWTFVAAVVCKALWPCGTMPAMPASWWGSTEHRCPHCVDTFHHLGFRLIERWFTQNNGDLIFWFTRTESYWNWMELETCWNK